MAWIPFGDWRVWVGGAAVLFIAWVLLDHFENELQRRRIEANDDPFDNPIGNAKELLGDGIGLVITGALLWIGARAAMYLLPPP